MWKIIGLLAILIVVGLWNGYTDMYGLIPGKSYSLFIITGILGTICMLRLAVFVTKRARVKSIFQLLGTRTFVVLISHYYICRMLIPMILSFLRMEFLAGSLTFQVLITIIIVSSYYRLFLCFEKAKT